MTMNLQDVGHQDIRHLLGNRAYTIGTLAIDGTNTENVQTTGAVVYSIKGILYSKAAVAEIDISALSGLPTTALADGYTQIFGLELDSAGTITVVYGEQRLTADITAGDKELDWPKASDDDHTMFGAIKVANATGSDFTFGTTGLDTAGITDTYYNLALSSY